MKQPSFSVIVPIHNRAHLIGECIQSVLAQTFADFELILVDNNSTDDLAHCIGTSTYLSRLLLKNRRPGSRDWCDKEPIVLAKDLRYFERLENSQDKSRLHRNRRNWAFPI